MNASISFAVRYDGLVLIDTWWNVNKVDCGKYAVLVKVLIDTWWNVNPFSTPLIFINPFVLIDTWWNVNL